MAFTIHAEENHNRKDADFDLVSVPEHLGSVTRQVTEDKIRSFAFAQGNYGSWYFEDSPFGGRVCHPMLFANDLLFIFYETYDGNTAEGLHTHQQLSFHDAARPGEKVTVTGDYVEKYEKRGQGYVVLLAEARGEDGRLLVTHRGTEIMRTRVAEVAGRNSGSTGGRRVLAMADPEAAEVKFARVGIPTRSPLPRRTRHFTQDQMNVYSWLAYGYKNVHTDIGRARDSGAERTVVQALQQTGILVDMLVDFFGSSWFTTGRLDLRYVNPSYRDEELVGNAVVLGDDGDSAELEVWVENADGEKKVLGWATADIDASTESRPIDLLERRRGV